MGLNTPTVTTLARVNISWNAESTRQGLVTQTPLPIEGWANIVKANRCGLAIGKLWIQQFIVWQRFTTLIWEGRTWATIEIIAKRWGSV